MKKEGKTSHEQTERNVSVQRKLVKEIGEKQRNESGTGREPGGTKTKNYGRRKRRRNTEENIFRAKVCRKRQNVNQIEMWRVGIPQEKNQVRTN
jgi:hypothetical protein